VFGLERVINGNSTDTSTPKDTVGEYQSLNFLNRRYDNFGLTGDLLPGRKLSPLTKFQILANNANSKFKAQDTIYFYFGSTNSYSTSSMMTLKYTVCGDEEISLVSDE